MRSSTSLFLAVAFAGGPCLAEPIRAADGRSPKSREAQTGELPAVVPLRLHLGASLTRAFDGYQSRELGVGAVLGGAVEWALVDTFGVELAAQGLMLADGDENAPNGVAELSGANGAFVGLGVRWRPLGTAQRKVSWGGTWLAAELGVAPTGGQAFPAMGLGLGFDFFVSERIGLGPALGYLHVFDTEEGPRSDDGSFPSVGLHLVWDGAARKGAPLELDDEDRDGVLDEHDRCPQIPEDLDGFSDEDGCPDPDNDEDGIKDVSDRCPSEAEDLDQFEDQDGCPDPDNDGDEVPDPEDKCPRSPEDRDNHQDEDGCPEEDNDGDQIPDIKDLCPAEPETVNGFSDNDGCPDEEHVRVVGDKIELDQKIHFWSDSAVIRGISYPVLTKLAEFMNDHLEYVHIDIEGHADERGPAALNQSLSEARANSVLEFLVKKGVSRERLTSAGFGATRPLSPGKSEHDWFLNRRVEFIVTRAATVEGEAAPKPQEAALDGTESQAAAPEASGVQPPPAESQKGNQEPLPIGAAPPAGDRAPSEQAASEKGAP